MLKYCFLWAVIVFDLDFVKQIDLWETQTIQIVYPLMREQEKKQVYANQVLMGGKKLGQLIRVKFNGALARNITHLKFKQVERTRRKSHH